MWAIVSTNNFGEWQIKLVYLFIYKPTTPCWPNPFPLYFLAFFAVWYSHVTAFYVHINPLHVTLSDSFAFYWLNVEGSSDLGGHTMKSAEQQNRRSLGPWLTKIQYDLPFMDIHLHLIWARNKLLSFLN